MEKSSRDLATFVHRYIKELDSLEEKGLTRMATVAVWKHPSTKVTKINFDMVFDRAHFISGSGVVARNVICRFHT